MTVENEGTNLELTPEIKEALINGMPFSEDSEYTFIPELYNSDKIPIDFRPKVTIKPLPRKKKQRVEELSLDFKKNKDLIYSIYRECLVNIFPYFDLGTEELLPFKEDAHGHCDAEFYADLPMMLKIQISQKINDISGVSYVEKLGLK